MGIFNLSFHLLQIRQNFRYKKSNTRSSVIGSYNLKHNNISYKYWLDKAVPADKKAYPKRLIIVALSTIASLIMCILVLLVMERSKQWNITADNKQE